MEKKILVVGDFKKLSQTIKKWFPEVKVVWRNPSSQEEIIGGLEKIKRKGANFILAIISPSLFSDDTNQIKYRFPDPENFEGVTLIKEMIAMGMKIGKHVLLAQTSMKHILLNPSSPVVTPNLDCEVLSFTNPPSFGEKPFPRNLKDLIEELL